MFKLTENIIKAIDKDAGRKGSILIFLPGMYEIGQLHSRLQDFSEMYAKFVPFYQQNTDHHCEI